MEDQKQEVVKVTLSTGKVVHLKPMKIRYQNLALKAVGNKAGENQALLGSLMQQELLKILLVDVNGAKPEKTKLEDLDGFFGYDEYLQIGQVMGQLMGGGSSAGEPQVEFASA